MPRLYAYLVGIGNYPVSDPNLDMTLKGPPNDVPNVVDFLDAFTESQKDLTLCVHQLIDAEATRQKVIDGFAFLGDAGRDDFVLFYYSGHGSKMPVARIFANDLDSHQESFVCYDSRTTSVDLMDKEVAYLLHKYTHEAAPHAVAILDSCHSGGMMRNLQARARLVPPSDQVRTLDSYYEHQHYLQDDDTGLYRVPKADIVLLAACRPDQRSKETWIGDQDQGIFTFALLQSLRACGNHISYGNLINKSAVLVDQYSSVQHPLLDTYGERAFQANRYFLDGALNFSPTKLLATKDRFEDYQLNAGRLHGISTSDILRVEDQQLRIDELRSHSATVGNLPGFEDQYEVQRTPDPTATMRLSWASDVSEADKVRLRAALAAHPELDLTLTDARDGVVFTVYARDNAWFIGRLGDFEEGKDPEPVFRPVPMGEAQSDLRFLRDLSQLARFRKILALTNTSADTQVSEDVFAISFYRISEPGNYDNNAPREHIASLTDIIDLKYGEHDGKWYPPGFQMSITNKSAGDIWVSVLYLGPGYADELALTTHLFTISNQFLPDRQIPAGETVWLGDDAANRTWSLDMLDDQYAHGAVTSYDCVFKVFVAGSKVQSSRFNQPGVPLQPKGGHSPGDGELKGKGAARAISAEDWCTREVRVRLVRDESPTPSP